MSDEALRQACEEWLADPEHEFDLNKKTGKPYQFQIELLRDFARQQQAVGVRMAQEQHLKSFHGFQTWCEQKARDLEVR